MTGTYETEEYLWSSRSAWTTLKPSTFVVKKVRGPLERPHMARKRADTRPFTSILGYFEVPNKAEHYSWHRFYYFLSWPYGERHKPRTLNTRAKSTIFVLMKKLLKKKLNMENKLKYKVLTRRYREPESYCAKNIAWNAVCVQTHGAWSKSDMSRSLHKMR